jgi:hypothetical protein
MENDMHRHIEPEYIMKYIGALNLGEYCKSKRGVRTIMPTDHQKATVVGTAETRDKQSVYIRPAGETAGSIGNQE